jgi:hypothetical protein
MRNPEKKPKKSSLSMIHCHFCQFNVLFHCIQVGRFFLGRFGVFFSSENVPNDLLTYFCTYNSDNNHVQRFYTLSLRAPALMLVRNPTENSRNFVISYAYRSTHQHILSYVIQNFNSLCTSIFQSPKCFTYQQLVYILDISKNSFFKYFTDILIEIYQDT